jgi:hypothetical protein
MAKEPLLVLIEFFDFDIKIKFETMRVDFG